MNERERGRGWTRQIGVRGLIVALAFTSFACWAKESDFFAPTQLDPSLLPDITAPIYSNIRPLSTVSVLNSNVLSFTLADPSPGSNGATASGVDVSTVTAKLPSGTSIPLTASGLNFTGNLSSLSDGAVSISLSAKDKAGNTGTSSLGFNLDRTAPVINLTTVPPATQSSSSSSLDKTIGGRITDSNFGTATLNVTQPGPDGQCATADDVAWPTGTTGGTISQNSFDLTSQVKNNSGTFSVTYTAFNGVPTGGTPRTAVYCGYVRAFDTAKDENGADKFNVNGSVWRTDVTWSNPVATINFTLNPTCQHFTTFSRVFLDVQTSPQQVTSPYTASVTGPPGGVSGSGNFSGNLDAQGHVFLQNDIFVFGTYNWSVTVNGQTATAQKVVNATSCQ